MPKKKYTAEFKTKVILTIIQGDSEFNAIYNTKEQVPFKCKEAYLIEEFCRFYRVLAIFLGWKVEFGNYTNIDLNLIFTYTLFDMKIMQILLYWMQLIVWCLKLN